MSDLPVEQVAHATEVVDAVMSDMVTESHRGIALVGVNYLEAQLKALLRAFLVDSSAEVDQLFQQRGPLGDFDSKLKMAYCLGLLTSQEYHDLKIIQWVRNRFAHHPDYKSFTHADIRQRCRDFWFISEEDTRANLQYLHTLNPEISPTAENVAHISFIFVVAVLCGALSIRDTAVTRRAVYTEGFVNKGFLGKMAQDTLAQMAEPASGTENSTPPSSNGAPEPERSAAVN